MKAQRPGGSPVQQHYDKIALVAVLLLLTVSAIMLVMQVSTRRKALEQGAHLSAGGGQPAVGLDLSNHNQRVETIRNPVAVPAGSQRLAVGELRVACVNDGKPIPYEAMVCPFCGAAQPDPGVDRDSDGDKIPDEEELKMGLNYSDPTDARLDPDGDRYSNLDEFMAKTSHTNAASQPPPHTKLRLVRIKVDPFRMRFVSVQDSASGVLVFQLNLRSLERTYLKKLGEEAEGWVLTSYDAKAAEGPTLVLKKGDSLKPLVRGKIIQEDFKTATLVSLLDLKQFPVKKDDVFKLQERSYKVVDIGDTRVVIRDESTGSDITVERPTEADRLFLQGAGGEAAAVPGVLPGIQAARP